MTATITTRMPSGVTNAAEWQTMGAAGLPDPSWAHVYHEDFNDYTATDWSTTTVGTGTGTLISGDGGILLLTTSTGAADAIEMQKPFAGFVLAPTKESFFKFTGTLGDAVNEIFYAGLLPISATPLATTDGLYITKAAGVSTLSLVSKIGGVTTTTAFPASVVLAAGVAFELGLRIAYNGDVYAYFNPTTGINPLHTIASGTSPAQGRGAVLHLTATTSTIVTQQPLSPSFGLINSVAAAHTLAVDYITAVRHR